MKYTARIISKNITNGLLTIEIEYRSEDGQDIFNDSVSTRSVQDENWLVDTVNRKLSELETIHSFADAITVGSPIEAIVVPTISVELAPKDEYKSKLEEFNKLQSALAKGFITPKDEEFIASLQWLRDNWTLEYLDFI